MGLSSSVWALPLAGYLTLGNALLFPGLSFPICEGLYALPFETLWGFDGGRPQPENRGSHPISCSSPPAPLKSTSPNQGDWFLEIIITGPGAGKDERNPVATVEQSGLGGACIGPPGEGLGLPSSHLPLLACWESQLLGTAPACSRPWPNCLRSDNPILSAAQADAMDQGCGGGPKPSPPGPRTLAGP